MMDYTSFHRTSLEH